MGSFHVGGRLVEISGKPVKDVTFTPGGVHRTLIHIPAAGHNRLLDHPDVAALLHDVAVAGATGA